jgi:hypothetical protein
MKIQFFEIFFEKEKQEIFSDFLDNENKIK